MRARKTILLLLIVLFGCICLGASAEYSYPEKEFAVIDNAASVNLREGPGYHAKVLGSYPKGEWVEIQISYGEWDLVRIVRTGRTGYMVDSYLTRPQLTGDDVIGIVANQSARAFLNLREYPSYDARVLGIYYNGATCRILSQQNGWYYVEIDGMLGYFRQEFIRRSGGTGISYAYAAASGGRSVNFRQGPSLKEKVLAKVPLGQTVEVLLKGKEFWYVRYQGLYGFMSSSYLKATASPAGPTPAPPAPVPVWTNAYALINSPSGLNLREQPSASSRVLTACANGSRVEILNPGLTWCKVRSASGETGYMMTRYLTVFGVPGTPILQIANSKTYVNLRSTPRIQAGNVLAELVVGEEVTVLIPGEEWTKVSWEDIPGYVMTCFLK